MWLLLQGSSRDQYNTDQVLSFAGGMSPHIELVNDWAYFLWEGVDEEDDLMMVTDEEIESDEDGDMSVDLDEMLEQLPIGYIISTPPGSEWGDEFIDELPPLEWFGQQG